MLHSPVAHRAGSMDDMPQLVTVGESPRLEPLLTIRDVATVLGISRESVYRLIRAGELEPIRVGHRARFTRGDLRDYLERQRESGP
jgi:excisionase family DNA binding protein